MSEAKPSVTASKVVVSSKSTSQVILKRWLLGLVSIVIVGGIGTGLFLWHNSNKVPITEACAAPSRKSILQEAAPLINNNQLTKLQPIVTKIQGFSNYQADPNCLYTLVSYYIMAGNLQKSSSYLSELKKVYNVKEGYSPALGYVQTISTLQFDVSAMQRYHQAPIQGITFSTRP